MFERAIALNGANPEGPDAKLENLAAT